MTIDEAIKELDLLLKEEASYHTKYYHNAIKLLIEAGKRVKDSQQNGRNLDYQLLPGETKD